MAFFQSIGHAINECFVRMTVAICLTSILWYPIFIFFVLPILASLLYAQGWYGNPSTSDPGVLAVISFISGFTFFLLMYILMMLPGSRKILFNYPLRGFQLLLLSILERNQLLRTHFDKEEVKWEHVMLYIHPTMEPDCNGKHRNSFLIDAILHFRYIPTRDTSGSYTYSISQQKDHADFYTRSLTLLDSFTFIESLQHALLSTKGLAKVNAITFNGPPIESEISTKVKLHIGNQIYEMIFFAHADTRVVPIYFDDGSEHDTTIRSYLWNVLRHGVSPIGFAVGSSTLIKEYPNQDQSLTNTEKQIVAPLLIDYLTHLQYTKNIAGELRQNV